MEERPSSKRLLDISASAATVLLGLLLLLTALRGALYIIFIPPWQSPDEPTHFEYAKVLASGENPFRPRPDPELQKRIIRSMDRFDFWRLVFVDAPDPLPETFNQTPFLRTAPSQLGKNPPLYYFITSIFLRLSRIRYLLSGMYQLRILSLLFTIMTVVVVFATAREFAPGQPLFCLAAAVFAAFLPQFMVIGTSVSPDPLINLIGALLVLFVVRSLRLGWKTFPMVLVGLIFWLGLMTSYKFFMILPALALWIAILYAANRPRYFTRRFLLALVIGLAAAVLVMVISPCILQVYSRRLGDLAVILQSLVSGKAFPPPGYWSWFHRELFKSTWLKFGWLKFELALPVYSILGAVTVLAATGVALTAVKTIFPGKKRETFNPGVLVVLIAFAFSVLSAYYCFWGLKFHHTTTQGRHFFIAMPAGAILMILGWGAFFPWRWRNLSYFVFMAGMILLDLVALFGYIRPAFT